MIARSQHPEHALDGLQLGIGADLQQFVIIYEL
jgi:hypothetical protein